MTNLKIEHAQDDINYFNGVRNTVKLLNHHAQYLKVALDEVPQDKLKDTIQAWYKSFDKDMNGLVDRMYWQIKEVYGMSLRIDSNGDYYIELERT